MKIKSANSLAEVLITLMIIGVVASVTVPVMKKHTQRTETVTKLKKAYMTLEQTVDAAIIDKGDIQNGNDVRWHMNKLFIDYLVPEMEKLRDCTSGSVSSCMSADSGASAAIVTMDGVAIGNNGMDFYVDVNNTSLPNTEGVDIFKFTFEKVGEDVANHVDGDWKFVPKDHAVDVINDGWKITYW